LDERLHQELLKATEELRGLVGACSTETIVEYCTLYFIPRKGLAEEGSPLSSQVRQWFFLLGLMLPTPEPKYPKEFDEPEFARSVGLLESIFSSYVRMFWPPPEEQPGISDQWMKVREVSMPAFLHYFNTALLANVDQISDRIRLYLSPFDAQLKELVGVTASAALNITIWVGQSLQQQVDRFVETCQKVYEALEERQPANNISYLQDEINDQQGILKVSRASIEKKFGATEASSFWDLFVSKRGEATEFRYLTERNIAEEKPLFEISDGIALCPYINALYSAVLKVFEQRLSSSPMKEVFLKKRDRNFEGDVESKLRTLFGTSAEFFVTVYETPDSPFEHDLVIRWNRRLFIIEAKASPPTEPFRDPDKAFVRLKRAFQSETGIQKAFDQANRISKRLALGETIELFDSTRKSITTIRPQDIDSIYCICVTRDDFGPIATNLSLLLEKEEQDSYPWAVNIFDLERIVEAWSYYKWPPDKLCEYLDTRLKLHGKVFSTDELQIAGCFIKHGGLHHLLHQEADRIFLPPEYADIFDKIYLAKHEGEEVVYAPTEPHFFDPRKMLSESINERVKTERNVPRINPNIKQGRNDQCACGSGRKYKRCCGK
jgi:hypothetical protein